MSPENLDKKNAAESSQPAKVDLTKHFLHVWRGYTTNTTDSTAHHDQKAAAQSAKSETDNLSTSCKDSPSNLCQKIAAQSANPAEDNCIYFPLILHFPDHLKTAV